jgi:hypothetical protein
MTYKLKVTRSFYHVNNNLFMHKYKSFNFKIEADHWRSVDHEFVKLL